jgi:hypothetical protein
MLGDSASIANGLPVPKRRKAYARARASNEAAVLPDVDGRTVLGRRFRDIAEALMVDQGGADRLSEARIQLIRRFAAAACLAEQMESKLVRGEQIDLQEHATLCSSLVRLGQRIGIDRRAKNITPSLAEYLTPQEAAE